MMIDIAVSLKHGDFVDTYNNWNKVIERLLINDATLNIKSIIKKIGNML